MSTNSSEGTTGGSGTSGYDAESDYETIARSSASSYWSGGGSSGASGSNGSGNGAIATGAGYSTPSYAASDYVGNGEANLSRGAITSRTAPGRSAAPVGQQAGYPSVPASSTPTASSSVLGDDYAATSAYTASPVTAQPAGAGLGAAAAGVGAGAGVATGGNPLQPRSGASGSESALPRKTKGPRRVRLAVARVDPWSVMKMSFLLSVALGIAGVILTAVLWMILSTMNVFVDIEGVLQSLQTSTTDPFSIKDYVGFGRVVSLSIVIGVIDVILLTAIATVMAFLYNICSALVGGIQLTLTDD